MKKILNSLGQTTAQRRWTRQATLCYYLGFNCSKCDIPIDLRRRCQMKASILELVREFGKPPQKFVEMIEAELSGEIVPEEYYILGEEET